MHVRDTWQSMTHTDPNQTQNQVYDIVVDGQSGLPVSILLKVRKATPQRPEGYHGECFFGGKPPSFEGAPSFAPSTEAIIAIGTWKQPVDNSNPLEAKHTRRQFPLALAWALTVHKAQGLTLSRVVFDPNDDERNIGITFVAMTRVRHPHHFVMVRADGSFPDMPRLTSFIACTKPALYQR